MIQMPANLVTTFLQHSGVPCRPDSFDGFEWLRYYIDFCRKYNFWKKEKESLAVFVGKLKGKEQAEGLGTQAHHAVSFFYEMDQCSAEKVKNDIPPAVKDIISEQASIDATYLHTKKFQPNQAVLYLHMITMPTAVWFNRGPGGFAPWPLLHFRVS